MGHFFQLTEKRQQRRSGSNRLATQSGYLVPILTPPKAPSPSLRYPQQLPAGAKVDMDHASVENGDQFSLAWNLVPGWSL
jgi:hypothetical protein